MYNIKTNETGGSQMSHTEVVEMKKHDSPVAGYSSYILYYNMYC